MSKKDLKNKLDQINEMIEELSRGGHSYNSYYGDDSVVYANIKNYNFADIDSVKKLIPKKYHKLFDRDITDEIINDIEWNCRNWRIEGIKDNGYYSEKYPSVEFVGCYGRSGGWYGLTVAESWHDDIDEMIEAIDEKPNERQYTLADINQAVKAWDQVQKCLDEIEAEAKAFDGTDEVFCSIEANWFEGWDDEIKADKEVKKAKELAKKHGYILAKEVK